MFKRLENASTGLRGKANLVMGPTIPISLPLPEEKDDGEEEREKLEASQPYEAMVNKHTNPFSEAPINMINLAWAEKGKAKVARETEEGKPADKSTKGVIKLPEHLKAAIIKGMVLCGKCQCECELEIPLAEVLIDHELIKRKEEEERKKARKKARRTTGRDTS
ncbi:hypothetical protein ACFX1S_031987 [Malus domestica]